jgi:hypothetical protein
VTRAERARERAQVQSPEQVEPLATVTGLELVAEWEFLAQCFHKPSKRKLQ